MKWTHKIVLAASVLTFATGIAANGTADAATASPATISRVSFSGSAGPGVVSPTLTIDGSGFGAAPAGRSDDVTSCGTYTNNGSVYGNQLYSSDVNDFEAGYSDSSGANCIGISILSWSNNQVVLRFGSAYGTFQHWYLSNGDSYDIYIGGTPWGEVVDGLS